MDTDGIKQDLLAILNDTETLKKVDKVLKKYDISEERTVEIEFNISETNQLQTSNTSPQSVEALAVTVASNSVRIKSVWCGHCPPPPGKWI